MRSLRTALEGDGSGLLPPLKVIFVRPPSLKDLERRLRDRGTEEEGAIQKVRGEESISFFRQKNRRKNLDSGQAFVCINAALTNLACCMGLHRFFFKTGLRACFPVWESLASIFLFLEKTA